MKPIADDPNKNQTDLFREYVRTGRGHLGGLISACNDIMFLLRWLAEAHALIMLLLAVDEATMILSSNAGGHKIIEKMKAHMAAYKAAVGDN